MSPALQEPADAGNRADGGKLVDGATSAAHRNPVDGSTRDVASTPADKNGTALAEDPTDHPDVVLCPGGPMLLRGDHVVQDEDGNEHRTWRPVTAVCMCGGSAIKPWCDGTHKVMRKNRPAR